MLRYAVYLALARPNSTHLQQQYFNKLILRNQSDDPHYFTSHGFSSLIYTRKVVQTRDGKTGNVAEFKATIVMRVTAARPAPSALRQERRVRHDDPGAAHAFAPHQGEQLGGVRRMQAHAAV